MRSLLTVGLLLALALAVRPAQAETVCLATAIQSIETARATHQLVIWQRNGWPPEHLAEAWTLWERVKADIGPMTEASDALDAAWMARYEQVLSMLRGDGC